MNSCFCKGASYKNVNEKEFKQKSEPVYKTSNI